MRDDVFHRVAVVLWRVLNREKGRIRAAEKHLGRGRNFLWTRRKRRTLDLTLLGQLLGFLKLPPAWFFRMVYPLPPGPLPELLLEADHLRTEVDAPPILETLRTRWLHEEAVHPRSKRTGTNDAIDRLEQLRLVDAKEAARRAETYAGQARHPAAAAGALGVWASALRADPLQLDTAFLLLTTALEFANRHRLPACLARQYQRMAYLLSERGQPGRGLVCADAALVLYCELADTTAQGKTHVDRAVMRVHTDDLEEAQIAYQAALAQLPESEAHQRAAALQGLAYCFEQKGNPEVASRHLAQALHIFPPHARRDRAVAKWGAARLAVRLADLGGAAQLYTEALEALADSPSDYVLVAADWLDVLRGKNR